MKETLLGPQEKDTRTENPFMLQVLVPDEMIPKDKPQTNIRMRTIGN